MCQLVASNSKHLSACSSGGLRCTVLLLVSRMLTHASPVSQQWPRSPVHGLAGYWLGQEGWSGSVSLVIPKPILGLFTWQWVAGHPGAAREEAGRLWTCTALLPPDSVVRASNRASPDPWSRENSSMSWRKELAKHCGSFCNSLFPNFLL